MATVRSITEQIQSWFVPQGFAGPQGHAHLCSECGVCTYGPGDPLLSAHRGGCSVYRDILVVLG